MADDTRALDRDAIRARAEAATEGPWEAGYLFGHAGVIFNRFGVIVGSGHADATRCALCVLGEPVWTGEMNINGEKMPAHRHRELSPHNPEHLISSAATGRLVAGNFATEQGGIVSPADTAFVMHARADIPALLDEVDRLNRIIAAMAKDAAEHMGELLDLGEEGGHVADVRSCAADGHWVVSGHDHCSTCNADMAPLDDDLENDDD